MDRKVEAAIPAPPRVETRRNPNDEQLAQVLDITPKVEPEKVNEGINFDDIFSKALFCPLSLSD